MNPDYSIPLAYYLDLSAALLLNRRRSFGALARAACARRGIPARVLGREHVPTGPGLITINHYHSARFWSAWMALAVSAQVPAEIYWTIASAWTFPGNRLGRMLRPPTQWLFTRIARIYNLNSMPPMPPAPAEITARAASVRRMLAYARSHPTGLLGLAPEGGDQPGALLTLPPNGAGRLALTIARLGWPIYPAGIYEESDGSPTLAFGPPYRLEIDPTAGEQADRLARETLMKAIAQLLPPALRGPVG